MNRKKYPIAATAGLALSPILTGYTDPAVTDAMESIDSIGTVSIELIDAISSFHFFVCLSATNPTI